MAEPQPMGPRAMAEVGTNILPRSCFQLMEH
jgi:hypothetical protein